MEMTEILVNCSYGGFRLSQKGLRLLAESGVPIADVRNFSDGANPERRVIYLYDDGSLDAPYFETHRDDRALLVAAKQYPHMMCEAYCVLGICLIPSDIEWTIIERDGIEYVAEKHRRFFPRIIQRKED
jgi:hypothetical protein